MYIYLYTYVWICKYLPYVTHLIICNGFVFGGSGLSTEHAAAHPLHLSLFPLGIKVLDIIELAATLYSFT